MDPDPQTAAAEYYVLTRGGTFGPFLWKDIVAKLNSGQFAPDDFVQIEGRTKWNPLGSFLDGKPEVLATVAPAWETILKVGWLRLRNDVEERSFAAGAICLGAGAACMILANWPFMFWAPWFAAAAGAAAVLLRRQQSKHGVPLLLAALCIPLAVGILPLKIDWRPTKPLSNSPSTASPAPQSPPAPPIPATRTENAPPGNIPGLTDDGHSSATDTAARPPPSSAPSPPETSPTPVPFTPHYAREPVESPDTRFTTAGPVPNPAPAPNPPVAPEPPAPLNSEKSSWWSFLFGGGNPTPSGDATPAPDAFDVSALERNYATSLVLATGDEGAGSGFICRNGTGTLLYTNVHVIADLERPTFTRNDGVIVSPGRGEVAAGRDVARFEVTPAPPKPFETITNFDANVRIGDAVAVLGNSGGGGVVTSILGAIDGIGPDRIEVSAKFIPGNSGSPIIHLKSGKVIGIATYAMLRSADTRLGTDATVRRFGYRIDNAATWEGINWPVFRRDADSLKKIALVTEDLFVFLRTYPHVESQAIRTQSLLRDYSDWSNTVRTSTVDSEKLSATERFLREVRFLASSDVNSAGQQLTYTYFRDELSKQKKIRDRITTSIDNASSRAPSSLSTGHL